MNLYVPPVLKPIPRLVCIISLITAVTVYYVTRCKTTGKERQSPSILKKYSSDEAKLKAVEFSLKSDIEGFLGSQSSTTRPLLKTQLLLITYMRSGSTFTADILQQSPDVFYIYEPFKALDHEFFKSDEACRTVTGECRLSPARTQRLRYDIYNIFTCHISKVQKKVIRKLKQTNKASKEHQRYMKCLGHSGEGSCIQQLESNCTTKPVSMIKSIRLTLDFTLKLFTKLPNLKIVHLLRDPRGILDSRRRGGYVNLNNISSSAKVLCERMTHDLQVAKLIKRKFPDQYIQVYYEFLARYPQLGAQRLYDFIGLPLTSTIKAYVMNITHASQNSGYFSTKRKDSGKVSNKWRQSLPYKYVKLIDSKCMSLYDSSEYNRISSRQHLNSAEFETWNEQ